MFRNVETDTFINMTLNGNLKCFIIKDDNSLKETTIDDVDIKYDNLVNLTEGE